MPNELLYLCLWTAFKLNIIKTGVWITFSIALTLYIPVLNTNSADPAQMPRLFVLRFYGPVNPMRSCRARSVYLTSRLLGKFSPLSG